MSAQQRPVAELLRRYRLAAGLSQGELADRAGLSRRGVSDIERGVIQTPHHDTLARLADALNLATAERTAFQAAARGRWIQQTVEPIHLPRGAGTVQSPLVGRHNELALIERHLAGAAPVLMFAGEPGIGKSRLLAEAAMRATAQGWRVIAGGCTRRSGQTPYEPVLSALARELRLTPPARQRLDLQGCGWLVRLLPELLETQIVPAPAWTLPPDQERRLLFGAVARYLANVAGPAGTLLLLDDLQWADGDALALLETLVREAAQSRPAPLRLLGAYRATEVRVEDPLGLLLVDLAREELVMRRQLPLLTSAEAAALLAHLWPESQDTAAQVAARQETLRRAEGLPFYLVSSAHALQEGGRPFGAAADPADSRLIPASVAESVQTRVAALPAVAQSLLGMAAVIGRMIPGALLLAMAPHAEEEVLTALDALARAGLLVEESDERYGFAHDLIREVVESGLGSQRRRSLHRRIGEELARGDKRTHRDQAAEIAIHFIAAGEQAQALPYALLAGDQAEAVYAHAEAEAYYHTALGLSQELHNQAQEAVASEKLGAILTLQGRQHDALAALERAADTYLRTGDGEGRLRVSAQLARLYTAMGRPSEGLERFAPLAAEAEEAGVYHASPGLARLYCQLAGMYATQARRRDDLQAIMRSEQLARAAGDDVILAQVLTRRARTAHILGDDDDAPDMHDVLPLAESVRDPQVLFELLGSLGAAHLGHGELDAAHTYIQRALALAEQTQNPAEAVHFLLDAGELAVYRGNWSQARTLYEQAATIHERLARSGTPMTLLYVPLHLRMLDTYEGAGDLATGPLEEMIALSQNRADRQGEAFAIRALAEYYLVAGQASLAYQCLAAFLARPSIQEWEWLTLYALPYQAWAELELGQVEQAALTSQDCVIRNMAESYNQLLVDALRVRALIAIRQEHYQEAASDLDEAIALCQVMPYPYAEAKALWVYGQLEANRGDLQAAHERFIAALAICDQLGEGLYRPHIERALKNGAAAPL